MVKEVMSDTIVLLLLGGFSDNRNANLSLKPLPCNQDELLFQQSNPSLLLSFLQRQVNLRILGFIKLYMCLELQ